MAYSAEQKTHELVVGLIKAITVILDRYSTSEGYIPLIVGLAAVLLGGAGEPTGSLWDETTEAALELMRKIFSENRP